MHNSVIVLIDAVITVHSLSPMLKLPDVSRCCRASAAATMITSINHSSGDSHQHAYSMMTAARTWQNFPQCTGSRGAWCRHRRQTRQGSGWWVGTPVSLCRSKQHGKADSPQQTFSLATAEHTWQGSPQCTGSRGAWCHHRRLTWQGGGQLDGTLGYAPGPDDPPAAAPPPQCDCPTPSVCCHSLMRSPVQHEISMSTIITCTVTLCANTLTLTGVLVSS